MAEPTISIPFEEFEKSPEEGYGERGFEATRTLRCAWADRLTLAQELQGIFFRSGAYTLDLPHLYPHLDVARCVGVPNIVGHDDDRPMPDGADTSVATYTFALLTVKYGVLFPNGGLGVDGRELTDETIEPFSEFLTLPPDDLTWGSGGDPLTADEAPGQLFRGFNWVFTRTNVLSIPSEYASLIGCVNNASITSTALGFTFPAETLLYTPPTLSRKMNPDGVTSKWTLTLRMSFKPQEWNKFFRAATGTYEEIFAGTTRIRPYTPADFSVLVT